MCLSTFKPITYPLPAHKQIIISCLAQHAMRTINSNGQFANFAFPKAAVYLINIGNLQQHTGTYSSKTILLQLWLFLFTFVHLQPNHAMPIFLFKSIVLCMSLSLCLYVFLIDFVCQFIFLLVSFQVYQSSLSLQVFYHLISVYEFFSVYVFVSLYLALCRYTFLSICYYTVYGTYLCANLYLFMPKA